MKYFDPAPPLNINARHQYSEPNLKKSQIVYCKESYFTMCVE